MTPEAQRIAIAEACGWTASVHSPTYGNPPWGIPPRPKEPSRPWEELPNYLFDLNAMHEAENVLLQRQRAAGSSFNNPDYGCWSRYVSSFISQSKMYGGNIHAPASVRAELFLKALGLFRG